MKILMRHLANLPSFSDSGNDTDSGDVVKRILDSNPLLEAFGNAKTSRNDNSSRFGKYIQLQIKNSTTSPLKVDCVLDGSVCESYLLEKSRVVGHEKGERTYHIFYQLLGAPESYKTSLWKGLSNTNVESFKYVGSTDTHMIEGVADGDKWHNTIESLAQVGVEGETLHHLMRGICIVLQLGNLTFEIDPTNDDGCIISSDKELDSLADLMGVSKDFLLTSLTIRTVTARTDVYKVPQNAVAAKDGCDALAKEIYNKIFDWLVVTINSATESKCSNTRIGLLDIFGFESFETNRKYKLFVTYLLFSAF